MPLPKPPATKAALLSSSDFDSQAAPKPGKRSTGPARQESAAPALLDLFDPNPKATTVVVQPPAAAVPAAAVPGRLPVKSPSRAPASRAPPAPPSCSCSTPTC